MPVIRMSFADAVLNTRKEEPEKVDRYSRCLVANVDRAILELERADSETALLFLRHLREMLSNGLPRIVRIAQQNRATLATASWVNAQFVLKEAEARGDGELAAFAREWSIREQDVVCSMIEQAST
jgi:hypothetical protein